jgi:predicted HTH transcriptional regulator
MDDDELEILLKELESDRVERKASISDKEKLRQAICAFANDMPNHRSPGVLFVGVNDDGSCANLLITDQLLRTLSDIRSDGNILPLPTITVQKRTLCGCEMAVVVVEPADAPPVRYSGRVWIRVGPRRAIASREEERRLAEKRRAKDSPFDISPLASATLDDFDLDYFQKTYLPSSVASEVLEENHRSVTEQLARNAVLHRNYEGTNAPVRIYWFSDRIEIHSPGGPFGQVNRQNFGQPGITDYRNTYIAEAMKNLGYVQKFGMGIQLARRALEKNGNPSPEFRVEDAHILVTVRK